jgi:hypothetical protein
MSSINLGGYLHDKGKLVRKQLESLSNEQLALWSDSLYSEGYETPAGHVERKADEFKSNITPF